MNYIVYLSLFLSVIISGFTVLFIKINSFYLKLILAFSGAFLFAISVLHLIPEIYASGDKSIGVYILIGFFLQILLEFFSEGIEHGHIHVHKHAEHAFPLTMMIGLSIHSFLEGMPLAESFIHETTDFKSSLLIGIILHNIPIAIALMSMLIQSHTKKTTAIFLLLFFAAMAPLGVLLSNSIGHNILNMSLYFNGIMGIVIGIFLHISTTILFESTENHRFNLLKFITIILGAGIAVIAT